MQSPHEEIEYASGNLGNEAEILMQLIHPNVCKIRGTASKGTGAYYETNRHDLYFFILDSMEGDR